jgi:serine/threonine protein kinase
MYDAIMEGKYSVEGAGWNLGLGSFLFLFSTNNKETVSEQGKEMVRGVLQKDPSKRISCKAVLESDWMKNSDLDKKVLEQTHRDLKAFNAKKKWKSSILAVVAASRIRTVADLRESASKRQNK